MTFFRRSAKRFESSTTLDTHLDADTLAAFAEHALSSGDEAIVFGHLAECGICRDYLAVTAELKHFHWSARAPQGHTLLRNLNVSRSVRTAAGIACSVAALVLFSSRPSHILVSTFKVPVNHLPVTRSVDRPILLSSTATLLKKPDKRSLSRPRSRTQYAATLDVTPQMPKQITTGWGKLPLQTLATNDFLAARNSHRFLKEVTLATVSFGDPGTTGEADNGIVAVNQIVLKTQFGERLITVEGFWEGPDGLRPQ